MSKVSLSPAQTRGAIAILGWSNQKLAEETGIYVDTINKFCRGESKSYDSTLEAIKKAFERNGLELLENDGVRRVSKEVEIYVGKERFHEFTEFIYQRLLERGGDVCISAVDETLFRKYRTNSPLYIQRMNELVGSGKVTVRILANKSEFKSSFAKFKYQPAEHMPPTAFYAFGDCLALISFEHLDPPYVVLHKSGPFAQAYIQAFNLAWENAKPV